MTLVALLDYASVLIFAVTGALVASRAQLDLVGFAFIACLTALGGVTIRDVLLDRNPIFWIANPTYLAVAAGADPDKRDAQGRTPLHRAAMIVALAYSAMRY